MIILGLDPGTTTTGFGIIEEKEKDTYKVLNYGVIETKPKIPQVEKLTEIFQDLNALVKEYKPDLISVEKVYYNKNKKTVISVSEARGVCLLIAGMFKTKVMEFTPIQVKNNLVGHGRAEKQQVQYMVKRFLKIKDIPKPDDAADALALAICASVVGGNRVTQQ